MNLRDLKLRVRALVAPPRVAHELDDEFEFHPENETQKYIERGLSVEEARRRARARFGSPALMVDQSRDARVLSSSNDARIRDAGFLD